MKTQKYKKKDGYKKKNSRQTMIKSKQNHGRKNKNPITVEIFKKGLFPLNNNSERYINGPLWYFFTGGKKMHIKGGEWFSHKQLIGELTKNPKLWFEIDIQRVMIPFHLDLYKVYKDGLLPCTYMNYTKEIFLNDLHSIRDIAQVSKVYFDGVMHILGNVIGIKCKNSNENIMEGKWIQLDLAVSCSKEYIEELIVNMFHSLYLMGMFWLINMVTSCAVEHINKYKDNMTVMAHDVDIIIIREWYNICEIRNQSKEKYIYSTLKRYMVSDRKFISSLKLCECHFKWEYSLVVYRLPKLNSNKNLEKCAMSVGYEHYQKSTYKNSHYILKKPCKIKK